MKTIFVYELEEELVVIAKDVAIDNKGKEYYIISGTEIEDPITHKVYQTMPWNMNT